MDLTPLINAVIALAAAAITAFVIPWLRKKLEENDLKQLESWVKIGVSAAEQLYTSLQGEEKKQYVLAFLREKGYDVSTQDVENAVEAAVLQLHSALYGAEEWTARRFTICGRINAGAGWITRQGAKKRPSERQAAAQHLRPCCLRA